MPRHVDAHRQAQEVVEPAHPLGVAPRQVVVDGDHVHALAGQRVQVDRQRGDQGLAFAGAHLGDLAVVQRDAADQLHVEVAHLQHALAGLAHHGKGLGQQLVERLALRQALAELVGLGAQRGVVQRLELRLERVDLLRPRAGMSSAGGRCDYRKSGSGSWATCGITKGWTAAPGARRDRARARNAIRATAARQLGSDSRIARPVTPATVVEFSTRALLDRALPGVPARRCASVGPKRRR